MEGGSEIIWDVGSFAAFSECLSGVPVFEKYDQECGEVIDGIVDSGKAGAGGKRA
jgi:hypothetical protein